MISIRTAALLLVIVLLAGLIVFLSTRDKTPISREADGGPGSSPDKVFPHEGREELEAPTEAKTENQAAAALLDGKCAELENLPKTEKVDFLRRMAFFLDGIDPEEAVAAILAELQTGRDAATGMALVAGEEELASAPTWRVFLLDRLGRIDPRQAAEYARQSIFPHYGSAEEWAVSIRNVLHSYPPTSNSRGRAEVSDLLGLMLAQPAWRAAQPEGLLEALDFVAHSADPVAHLSVVATWASESPNIAAAAQIAVERTMSERGDELLPAWARGDQSPGKSLRAPAMARADLRRPAQAQAVLDFLRGQPGGSAETEVFFRAFPMHRFSLAPGLAGVPQIPAGSDLRAADEAALAIVENWRQDPTLHAHKGDLALLAEKLRELIGRR
jgi:hypothetical protein